MARSLAFWLSNPKNRPTVELHFNYWTLSSGDINYLDIGVELSQAGTFESLNFYLPFDLNSVKYQSDLGAIVCKDDDLISAIFNSRKVKHEKHVEDVYDIDFSDNRLRFITQLDEQKNDSNGGVKIQEENSSSDKGLSVKFPSYLFKSRDETRKAYFRFRFKLGKNSENGISQFYKSKDALVTANLDTTEVIDFRINEPRNLPGKIRANLNPESPIKVVHFFLIREADTEFKMSNAKFKRCRLLERDLWDDYLCIDKTAKLDLVEQMLIYHWKDSQKGTEESIEHFSAFVKFTNRSVSFKKIGIIIGLIIVFGAMGSALASVVQHYFFTESSKIWSCKEVVDDNIKDKKLLCETLEPVGQPLQTRDDKGVNK